MTKEELQAAVDAIPYFYHRIELPFGIVTPGWAPISAAAYRIPNNLAGKTVLDVGAWDGYWTFEAIKRGALRVTAIDNFSDTIGGKVNADRSRQWETFDLCRSALGFEYRENRAFWQNGRQGIRRANCDIQNVYDIDESAIDSYYSHVFMFGVLYHLRHPLMALENVRSLMTNDSVLHIETAILDGCPSRYTSHVYAGDECCLEFYPGAEYGDNPSNWYVGTLRAWVAMVQAAGFKNVESWRLTDTPQHISQCRGFIKASV